ncbi:protein-export membrane protein SecD [Candidatus Woesebacteria bacterium RIFOXYB1_FULL_38_16]|uniref:Protein translocase subunit SecD n=1 Tax=Candidatus Woesebacteria bacterium RIFOXYB1_FULL_38_16 TaxID=1802538 RepID=A0A1F8CRR5_9BACT|nr:MAG: protein-export membrane protein SecD [Candidatus Woesebacteria bacterium RIFOXYA1_FULL_38_9]OGM79023.1 MAG: protein-export membrane protein SecD [Candidatus Woesebacteria bacterium RIFOXYB1_FULL_38_16]
MHINLSRRLLLIGIVFFAALFVSMPAEVKLGAAVLKRPNVDIQIGNFSLQRKFDLKMGLDLIGGSHLVFEVDDSSFSESEKTKVMDGLKSVIEKRVNLFGVSEPNVQTSVFEGKDRIIVELPGVKDTKEAIALVGKTAQLIFVEVKSEEIEGKQVEVLSVTDLTGADLKSADVGFDQVSGKPIVLLDFRPEGGKKFAELTKRNIGKALPIILDGEVVSAPVVQAEIVGGSAQITGDFTLEEAKNLVIQLNAGALPASISLVSERSIGASLGQEAVKAGVKAGAVGVMLVFVFMIIFYGKMGLVADLGLIVFGAVTLALYKLIPVVLTLPGIAGFLLSVGMAVDSNILTFERFREEKEKGVNLIWALETSFERAWDAIKDANIATLVTAFILANPFDWPILHTSGPVRGFAITLALGIGVSLFSGIFVSRNLLRLLIRRENK